MGSGAFDRAVPDIGSASLHFVFLNGPDSQLQRNFQGGSVVSNGEMKSEPHLLADSGMSLDRRIIRVDIPPAHAGITAALRRAFEGAAEDPCGRDFDELLQKLN